MPLAIVTVLTYLAAERALRDQVTTGLYAMARRQANQIATYVREREQNVATLSRMPGTIDALEDFARAFAGTAGPSPSFETLDRQYRPFLSYYQEAFGYDDLSLVLPDGRVVFSAQDARPWASTCAPIHTARRVSARHSIAFGPCSRSISPTSRRPAKEMSRRSWRRLYSGRTRCSVS